MPKNLLSQSSEFKIVAKSNSEAEIIIYGVIGGWYDGVTAAQFQKELKALGDVKKITVRLNSVGGDVFEGWTIYNLLKQHKAEVTVYVDGLAASIASIIALSGDKVIMGEGSQIMIHSAWTGMYGNARDFEAIITRLESIDEQLIKTYANKTGKDKEHIRTLVHAETYFTADEAIELGLADEKSGESQAIAACLIQKMSAMGIKKLPKNLKTENDLTKEKLVNTKNKILQFTTRK